MNHRQLLQELLEIYSPSYQEQAAVEYLVTQMSAAGMRAFRDAAGNAVGVLGDGPREIVMLGHIDTHPGLIEVERSGELLYGRGAVDAKGPLCTLAAAAARVGARDGWKLVVVGAEEEECPTSKGAHFAKTQYDPAFAIVGEPSGWDRVTLGYKGSLWLEYTLTRENAHSAGQARPVRGRAGGSTRREPLPCPGDHLERPVRDRRDPGLVAATGQRRRERHR